MKLLFIGAINYGNDPRGGDEYKNQLILSKLKESDYNLKIIDTSLLSRKRQFAFTIFRFIFFYRIDAMIISVSSVSAYKLIKIIYYFRPKLLGKTTYLVVGGFFPEAFINAKFNWIFYKKLKNILVQGNTLKIKLEANTLLKNVKVLPNFKSFTNVKFSRVQDSSTFKFVFLGRISKTKGIEEIIKASTILKEKGYDLVVDFYGPIQDNFQLNSTFLKYRGYLNFNTQSEESYRRLAQYDCMLFPTYWVGEGFPGVIIDAFVAGLPVIATDWNMNTEVIKNNVNGFIIQPRSIEELTNKMKWMCENRNVLQIIRENNKRESMEYHIDKIWPKFITNVVS